MHTSVFIGGYQCNRKFAKSGMYITVKPLHKHVGRTSHSKHIYEVCLCQFSGKSLGIPRHLNRKYAYIVVCLHRGFTIVFCDSSLPSPIFMS